MRRKSGAVKGKSWKCSGCRKRGCLSELVAGGAGEIPIVIAKTPQVWGRVVAAAPKHRPHRDPLTANLMFSSTHKNCTPVSNVFSVPIYCNRFITFPFCLQFLAVKRTAGQQCIVLRQWCLHRIVLYCPPGILPGPEQLIY